MVLKVGEEQGGNKKELGKWVPSKPVEEQLGSQEWRKGQLGRARGFKTRSFIDGAMARWAF